MQSPIMLEIRNAQPEDKETIQQIYHAVVGHHADLDETRWDRLIQQGGLVIAQAEGRIIGFGGIDVHAAEQLKWLYLLPQHRMAGYGSEILKRLESIGWDAGLFSESALRTRGGEFLPQTWLRTRRNSSTDGARS